MFELTLEKILALCITMVFSFLIGVERQSVRTDSSASAHVLVSISACGIAILQSILFEENNTEEQRLIAGVLTGMGFLGAGVIIKDGDHIKGLTTAATLWYCIIVSIILGMEYFALGITLAIFGVVYIYIRDIIRGVNPFSTYKKHDKEDK